MRIVLAAALLLAPALAPADDRTPDAQKMKTDDCARARKQNKTCVLDMGSETIEGGISRGDGERVDVRIPTKAASLIRFRRDFITEILKTAEDL
jgi:hypothetical protein